MGCFFYCLFAQHEALHGMRPPCGRIAANQHRAETWIAFGSFKTSWQPSKEALQDLLFLHANDAVIRAGHPDISLVRRAARQDPCVCRRDVSMRAENSRDAPIQVPAQRDFF